MALSFASGDVSQFLVTVWLLSEEGRLHSWISLRLPTCLRLQSSCQCRLLGADAGLHLCRGEMSVHNAVFVALHCAQLACSEHVPSASPVPALDR